MAVNDDVRNALESYGGFSINTRVYNYLGSLGYTGTISDRLAKYNYEDKKGWQALIARYAGTGWTPAALFADGQQGVWYEPKPEYLFQDAAGTVPVEADGDPVGYMQDLSGNGNHATQSTSAARPIYRTDGVLHWLEGDGVDDFLETGLVQFDGAAFYIASAMALTNSSSLGGPLRFLREGGSRTSGSDNLLEEYSSPNSNYEQKALVQRYPGTWVLYNADVRPPAGTNHVSWQTNGSTLKQQVIPSQASISDIAGRTLVSGSATLEIFQGYSGGAMGGRIYGFIWQSSTPDDTSRDQANQYLSDLAGVTL